MWPECVFTECEDATVSRTGILYTCTPIFFTEKDKYDLSTPATAESSSWSGRSIQ